MSDPKDIHPTTTQAAPNISTEHQAEGDARRPSDTLDREQSKESGQRAGSDDKKESKAGAPAPGSDSLLRGP